jgi:hypothetical protein
MRRQRTALDDSATELALCVFHKVCFLYYDTIVDLLSLVKPASNAIFLIAETKRKQPISRYVLAARSEKPSIEVRF